VHKKRQKYSIGFNLSLILILRQGKLLLKSILHKSNPYGKLYYMYLKLTMNYLQFIEVYSSVQKVHAFNGLNALNLNL
jgi:hypothetical protein